MRNKKFLSTLAFAAWAAWMPAGAENRPTGLMTDLMEHTERTWQNGYASDLPVWRLEGAIETFQYAAIRSAYPAFSWVVPGRAENTHQVAYRLIVADNRKDAEALRGNVWDSGTVTDSRSVGVRYAGPALQPDKSYFWRVQTVTDTEGESRWSEVKAFRTAPQLDAYGAGYYPQVKTAETAAEVRRTGPQTCLIDFGRDAFAQPVLTLTTEEEADTVVLHLGECLEQGRVQRDPKGSTIRYRRVALPLMKGTHTYRVKIAKDRRNTGRAAVLMPGYVGEVLPFRYCEVEGYAGPLPAAAAMREAVHYPFDGTAAAFRSSSDTLNQVWELCKYSIRATSFTGVYVDGDRERIPYEADALINQLCHYGVDREYSMARRSHEYLLQHPTWPTEWILQAVQIAWYDYMYTGDSRSLEASYEQLRHRSLLALREKNGLISTGTGLQTPEFLKSIRMKSPIRDIVDWPQTRKSDKLWNVVGESDGFVFTDYNAVTNAYHYEALKGMQRISEALGKAEEAAFFRQEAERFRKVYVRSFFRPEKGYFADGLKGDTEHASLHTNMFALAFGLVPEGKEKGVTDFIRSRGMACSVYGSQFLMDALYEAHAEDHALQMLTKTDDRSWYNMIRVGSTISLEAWDNKYKTNQDWNHAWGAAPANILPRRLMGVMPLTPGFGTVCVKPQVGSLEWAEATVPSVRGSICVAVENKPETYSLTLSIPANMDAEVYLPLPPKGYELTRNGAKVKASRVKGEPCLYAGRVGSGTYRFVLKRK